MEIHSSPVSSAAAGLGASATEGTISVVQVGQNQWTKSALFGTGDKWFASNDSSSLMTFPNPAKIFSTLKSGATSVVSLGSATIEGIKTSHYQMAVPTAAFDALGGNSSDAGIATGSISVQLWIDSDNLIRRLSAITNESGTTQNFTLDFTDYGETVEIQPPPPSQITSEPPTSYASSGSSESTIPVKDSVQVTPLAP
jgi:hypothetical protein